MKVRVRTHETCSHLIGLICWICGSFRHLQKFWGASGDFWQDLWMKLYVMFEGHDAVLFFLGKKFTGMFCL